MQGVVSSRQMYELGTAFENTVLAPGTNVLVTGPPLNGKRRLAMQVLTEGTRQDNGAIIVSIRDGADQVLTDFQSLSDGSETGKLGVVDCVSQRNGRAVEETQLIKYTASPTDLSGIGIKASEFLAEFSEGGLDEQNRVAIDSLTPLLLYSDLPTVFRFMHALTQRIQAEDAIGIHLIESTAHDSETITTLSQLFDGIVEVGPDRSVSIQFDGRAGRTGESST